MGMAALMGGSAAAGGIGGAIAGGMGSPDKVTTVNGSQNSTSQLNLAPLSPEQAQLQQSSMNAYLQQLALGQQYQQGIGAAQGLQNQAQGAMGNVLNGSAFQITPEQQALIDKTRNSSVAQSTSDINNLLNERLSSLSQQAGQQGLRGQAYTQLQGDTMRTAANQYGNTVRQADTNAAQQSLQMPYQTVAAQSPFIQVGSQMASQMQQQAMQNQQMAQNPYLLQLLQQQRLATGQQVNTGSENQQTVQKGTPGSFLGALGGFFSGAAGGASAGAQAGQVAKGLG